jgi:hypothetical protein
MQDALVQRGKAPESKWLFISPWLAFTTLRLTAKR